MTPEGRLRSIVRIYGPMSPVGLSSAVLKHLRAAFVDGMRATLHAKGEHQCRFCGCTETLGCSNRCVWVSGSLNADTRKGVCSNCTGALSRELKRKAREKR